MEHGGKNAGTRAAVSVVMDLSVTDRLAVVLEDVRLDTNHHCVMKVCQGGGGEGDLNEIYTSVHLIVGLLFHETV